MIISKNASNKKYSELNFLQKTCGRIPLSSPGVELGVTHYQICRMVKNVDFKEIYRKFQKKF